MSMTAQNVLTWAAGEIGYTRWDDPEKGSKYGRWYAKKHGAYYGTSGVPFCAMGASWCATDNEDKSVCLAATSPTSPTASTPPRAKADSSPP